MAVDLVRETFGLAIEQVTRLRTGEGIRSDLTVRELRLCVAALCGLLTAAIGAIAEADGIDEARETEHFAEVVLRIRAALEATS